MDRHLPRDNTQASAVFQLQAQKSGKPRWAMPRPAAMTNGPLPCDWPISGVHDPEKAHLETEGYSTEPSPWNLP